VDCPGCTSDALALSQHWPPSAAGQWTRADRRARVSQDTYQPVYTAETADGSRRRFYRFADAVQWADRWPDRGPTLDDPEPVRTAALMLPYETAQ
jgi:hypothetical protein